MAGKSRTREERLAAALRENLKRRKQATSTQLERPAGGRTKQPPVRPETAKKPE